MIRATRRPRQRDLLGLVLLACLYPGLAARAQQGEAAAIKRAATLRDAPGDSGRSLAALAAQEPVTRLGERQGGWIQVRTGAGLSGWVHMFDVVPAGLNTGAAASGGGNALTGSLRGLSSLLRGGSTQQPTVATSTLGIRGLDAENLARAQPDPVAVARMERLRQDEQQARQFAADAALAAAAVPPLPSPHTPQGASNSDPARQ